MTRQAGIVDSNGRGLGVVGGRPRRRRAHRPVRRQRHDRQLLVPQPGRVPVRGDRASRGRRRATPRAATRRGWAWLAATSTATAGSTWRSPTSTTSPPRFSGTWAHGFFADQTAAIGLAVPSRYVLGFGIAFLDAEQRRLARPDHRQRPRPRRPAPVSLEDAGPALPGGSATAS